jgi:hypothetical protein
MISAAEVEKLRGLWCPAASVLSVYLPVPLDPAALRGLPALAADLIDEVVTASGQADADPLNSGDRDAVLRVVEAGGRDWLGHTAAIFACGQLGLLEAAALPCQVPGRAVLAVRPHILPLLAALQRYPSYLIAVVDRRRSWLFSVTGDQVETITQQEDPVVPSRGFGGWYGLEAHRIQQRIIQFAGHHYRNVAVAVERQALDDSHPLVVGGHKDGIAQLLHLLSPRAMAAFAGSFGADPATLTPARARELAGPVIGRWTAQREQRVAAQVLDAVPAGQAVTGLPACLAAVNASAADLLLIPDDGLIPGFTCDRCGALTTSGSDCPDWGAAARPVPDLLDEMAARVLDDAGQVVAVRAPLGVAARLRYPMTRGPITLRTPAQDQRRGHPADNDHAELNGIGEGPLRWRASSYEVTERCRKFAT